MDWLNILLPGLFGLAGTGVGGWVTAKTQRQQLKHTDQAQWDQDKVKLAGEMIAISRQMAPLSTMYFHHWVKAEHDKAEDYDTKLAKLLDRLRSTVSQLHLMASPELSLVADAFYKSCDRRYTSQWQEIEDSEGNKHWIEEGNDESIDMEQQIQLLTATVKKEIRIQNPEL